ncbi:hypothetical protein BDV96DRAFT_582404, partial [Lophiotrema nucula]
MPTLSCYVMVCLRPIITSKIVQECLLPTFLKQKETRYITPCVGAESSLAERCYKFSMMSATMPAQRHIDQLYLHFLKQLTDNTPYKDAALHLLVSKSCFSPSPFSIGLTNLVWLGNLTILIRTRKPDIVAYDLLLILCRCRLRAPGIWFWQKRRWLRGLGTMLL